MGTDGFQILIHGTADEATRLGRLVDCDGIAQKYRESGVEFKAVDLGVAAVVAPFTYQTSAEIAAAEEQVRADAERAERAATEAAAEEESTRIQAEGAAAGPIPEQEDDE